MRLRVGARTDTGRVRALNEDVYVSRPERGLFVVCDGMGGAPAGEVASQVAVIDAANSNGGADNITVIVVEVVDRWWRRLAKNWNRQPGQGHDAEAHSAA